MTITATEVTAAQAQAVKRYGYRHFDDAASPVAIVQYPGFRPRYVCFEDITDRIKYEWYEGMATTDCIKTVAAGTRTLDTGTLLSVVTAAGSRPSITVAASIVLQNKQNYLFATN